MAGAEHGDARLAAMVHGRVQGVGFRYFARRTAAALGLRGYVRNRPGGAVEVVAEGPRPTLEELLRRLERGPSGARVEQVEVAWAAAEGAFSGFHIRV
jgi:acylphosphatase